MSHHPASILVAVVLSCIVTSSFACKCSGLSSVKAGMQSSAAVFTGRVLKVEYTGLSDSINPDSLEVARAIPHGGTKNFLDTPMLLKATILVTNEFKGVKKNDTIVVYTGIRGATCGFKFEQNKEYAIYATDESYMYMFFHVNAQRFKNLGRKGVYWTNICSRTTSQVGAEQGLLNEHLNKK
jgi:hypothetical protein